MTTRHFTAGGRAHVRRLLVVWLALCAIGVPDGTRLNAASTLAGRELRVHEQGGVYSVTARFDVPQPRSAALAVLTDYERIPRFMPDVETSVVLERDGPRAIIEQDAVSHMMMFRKRVHLVLEITEGADTVRFRDCSGASFVRYEGAWRLRDRGTLTQITYELTAQPSFDVPSFLLKRLLERDSGRMIEHLQREIAARAAE